MKKISLITFFLSAAVHLVAALTDQFELMDFSKPFLVLALIGYYWMEAERRSLLFIAALVFCWAGDIFLIFQSANGIFFMFGLVAFLIGHLFYMISYNKLRVNDRSRELLWTQKLRFSFPVILAGTGLIAVLFPKLGPLQIPVLIYSLVLMGMVLTALFRYGRTTGNSFWNVFSGATLFMISDSLLAINKFHSPIPMAGFLVMITYISAQYLIVRGVVEHKA